MKTRVEDALHLDKTNLKNDYFGFMEFLESDAKIIECVIPLREFRQFNKSSGKSGKKSATPKPTADSAAKLKINSSSKGGVGSSNKPKTSSPCLVPGSTKNEFVWDHEPKISGAEQKRLVEEYKRQKSESSASKKAKISAIRIPSQINAISTLQKLGNGRDDDTTIVRAELRGFEVSCRIDTRSDIPATISSTVIDFVDKKCIFLSTRGMINPSELMAADGHPIKYYGETHICP